MTFEATESTIRNFSQMTRNNFNALYSLTEPGVRKMDTNFREAVSVHKRLAITLRHISWPLEILTQACNTFSMHQSNVHRK